MAPGVEDYKKVAGGEGKVKDGRESLNSAACPSPVGWKQELGWGCCSLP